VPNLRLYVQHCIVHKPRSIKVLATKTFTAVRYFNLPLIFGKNTSVLYNYVSTLAYFGGKKRIRFKLETLKETWKGTQK
jgi:hypothetical protein